MRRYYLTLGHTLAVLVLTLATLAPGCDSSKIAGGEADGARIFAEACSRCHGSSGTPPPNMVAQYGVPDLRRPDFHRDNDLASIRKRIAQGSNRKGMPAFETAMSAAQLDAVAAHVKNFGAD